MTKKDAVVLTVVSAICIFGFRSRRLAWLFVAAYLFIVGRDDLYDDVTKRDLWVATAIIMASLP